MQANTVLTALGLVFAVLGSAILTFSASSIVRVLQMVIGAQEIFFSSLQTRDVVAMTGLDEQLKKAKNKSRSLVLLGLVFVLIGFILQLVGALLQPKA